MSSTTEAKEISKIDALPDSHRNAFRQALGNILSTDNAVHTYAQILDGLPTEQSFLEGYVRLDTTHPVFELGHAEICEGFLDKAREFRDRFDPCELVFKENVRLVLLIFLSWHE